MVCIEQITTRHQLARAKSEHRHVQSERDRFQKEDDFDCSLITQLIAVQSIAEMMTMTRKVGDVVAVAMIGDLPNCGAVHMRGVGRLIS